MKICDIDVLNMFKEHLIRMKIPGSFIIFMVLTSNSNKDNDLRSYRSYDKKDNNFYMNIPTIIRQMTRICNYDPSLFSLWNGNPFQTT